MRREFSHSNTAIDASPLMCAMHYPKPPLSRTNRIIIYSSILIVLSLAALVFYGLFKPSDVILNRLFMRVITITPIMTEHNNIIIDTFIQTFGDFISVIMIFMMLLIVIHIVRFPLHEARQLFQWIIVPFVLFESLQLIGIGNFYIRDLIAYMLGYQLSYIILNRVERTTFKSLFDSAFVYLVRRRKDKNHG